MIVSFDVSLTQGKAVYLKTLAAGLYKITAATNTSGVNNQTYYEKIIKASDYLSLSSSPNINYTYNGTKANITAKEILPCLSIYPACHSDSVPLGYST